MKPIEIRRPTQGGSRVLQNRSTGAIAALQPASRAIWPTPQGRYCYVYVRTKMALVYADTALNALGKIIGRPVELLTMTRMAPTWTDGMVFRLRTDDSPHLLAERWRGALANFDAWVLHDSHGSSAETLMGGLADSAFAAAGAKGTLGITQLYFAFRRRDTNRASAVGRLSKAFGMKAAQVFYFRDGRIVFLDTHESAETTRQRMAGKRLPLYWCAVCDASHRTAVITANPGKCWQMVSLDRLIATEESPPHARYIAVGRKRPTKRPEIQRS